MKLIFIILALLGAVVTKGTNYYISASGNDSYTSVQAQSPSTTWQTLAKINTSVFQAGDSILLNRGETFFGQIIISSPGLVVGAYGTGANPIVSGFQTVSSWSNSGNIWSASVQKTKLNVVTVNGRISHLGRYPNNYIKYRNFLGSTQIIDSMNIGHNWLGGELVVRKRNSLINRGLITAQSHDTITFSSYASPEYNSQLGFGYFIQNHVSTLANENDWCFNDSILRIYNPSGNVQCSFIDTLLMINATNTTLSNLSFEGANSTAIYINAKGTSVYNCNIHNSLNAIMGGGNVTTIVGDTIINILNDGIRLTSTDSSTIAYCFTKNVGFIAGMGLSGEDSYQAVIIRGNHNNILSNTIDSTGYSAIRFDGGFVNVSHNVISNFLFTKDDGAGIYTWNNNPSPPVLTDQIINGNLITNAIGAADGAPFAANANGIYLDEGSANIAIDSNNISNCKGNGLFIQDSKNVNVLHNYFANNGTQLGIVSATGGFNVSNLNIIYNYFYPKKNINNVYNFISASNNVTPFGIFDYNVYYPFSLASLTNFLTSPVFSQIDFKAWQLLGNDLHSTLVISKATLFNEEAKPILWDLNGKALKLSAH